MKLTKIERAHYASLYDTMKIRPERLPEIQKMAKKIVALYPRYDRLSRLTGVPKKIIAITHLRECNLRFSGHLHNGDPLTARTVRVPANRPAAEPASGKLPYTFEESALDCLTYLAKKYGFDLKSMQWTIGEMGFWLEAMNGFGYRKHGVESPYLWSYTTHYTKGLYVRDGVYDKTKVSRQMGSMALLREIEKIEDKPAMQLTASNAADLSDMPDWIREDNAHCAEFDYALA